MTPSGRAPGDRHVAGGLGDGHRRAQPRVQHADRGVAVRRGDEGLGRALDPQHGGAATGRRRRCWTGRWSRTARRPGGARRGSASRGGRAAPRPGPGRAAAACPRAPRGRPGAGAARRRAGARDSRSKTIASDASARAGMRAELDGARRPAARRRRARPRPSGPGQHDDVRLLGHPADDRHRQVPALADGPHGLPAVRLDDRDHPLLGLGDHDLERLQAGLPARDRVEVHEDPGAAAVRGLAGRAGDARRRPGPGC